MLTGRARRLSGGHSYVAACDVALHIVTGFTAMDHVLLMKTTYWYFQSTPIATSYLTTKFYTLQALSIVSQGFIK